MFSTRNHLPMHDIIGSSDDIDTVYETCDQEFNSRFDVHQSFQHSKGEASWSRYFLMHEIQKICTRDGINLAWAARKVIADRVAHDWYLSRAREEHASETESGR
jgi:hypothetical protein